MNQIFKKFRNISAKLISYNLFIKIQRFPFNRDEQLRIGKKKVIKKLQKLLDVHCVVVIGVLTKDCEYRGIQYKAGDEFKLDGNGRTLFWENHLSDYIPEELFAIRFEYPDMETMKLRYYTFDSATSAEESAEKLTGAMIALNMNIKSEKILKGQFVLALNCASSGMYPSEFTFAESLEKDIEKKVSLFREEILILDKINLSKRY